MMLCQFSFKNFKSYRDEATLDFQAISQINELDESLIEAPVGKRKFLPLAAIYGPNGGGKSGVIEALGALVKIVTYSSMALAHVEDIENVDENHFEQFTSPVRFLKHYKFDSYSKNAPSAFEVYFQKGLYDYFYKIELNREGIVREELYRKALRGGPESLLFDRAEEEVLFGKQVPKIPQRMRPGKRMPLLSFLYAAYDIPAIEDVISWFKSIDTVGSKNFPMSNQNIYSIVEHHEPILKVLRSLDLGITGFEITGDKSSDNQVGNRKKLNLIHSVEGSDYVLAYNEESNGTQRILRLLPHLVKSLREGSVLVIDELDQQLHPLLLRRILSMYNSKDINTGGGQLVFTSHDVSTLNSYNLRRDEIWFAAKGKCDTSCLYSLAEIKGANGKMISSSAPYDRQYMEGRYGADPYFSKFANWGSDE